jgi:hypothetical protein
MIRGKPLIGVLVAVLLLGCGTASRADLARLDVFPPEIRLHTALDRQLVVVQTTDPDGITQDVTRESKIAVADTSLVKLRDFTLFPIADGRTHVTISHGGRSRTVPIEVARSRIEPPVSFRLDVMPVLLKAGCNTGSCHGAARGKDGFRLSLFGFDPEGDHYRITREIAGRRVNLAIPADSTLLEKAIGAVPHTGGQRFGAESEMYRTLHRWIEAGARSDDAATLPTITAVELYPGQAVLDGQGAIQQMSVRARYSDGSDRDVTRLSVYLSNNDRSAAIDANGLITAGGRGEAFVTARFENHTVGAPIIVLPKGSTFHAIDEPELGYIDRLVADKLKKLRITPSGNCDDSTFVRRVYLDMVGVPPTAREVRDFLSSSAPDKRAKLIDALLGRKEFVEIWVNQWAEMLQVRSDPVRGVSQKAASLYYEWLAERISKNTPMDDMVRELLSASGGTFQEPETNFFLAAADVPSLAENVAQVFMGMRIQCAQCHNHPFDRWTQNDYYGFAAFFARIGRKAGEDTYETIFYDAGAGEMKHPVAGVAMKPKYLGGDYADVAGKDRRLVLARWLASPANPWFATSFANRVWAHFLGIGIVEPVDDLRVSNPPSNPELLEELGRRFTASRYDLRALVREICNSRTYQRSTERNESNAADERNFARFIPRRIKAETLLDAISAVTETRDKFPGLPLGSRAVQIADGSKSTYFLTTFGRSTRESACSCEVKMEPSLSQALHLLNGETVNAKIKAGGVVGKLIATTKFPEERIGELYLRCLSRSPTRAELDNLRRVLVDARDHAQALEDVFWAILNSREFLFNH